jgi:hypothetical protein
MNRHERRMQAATAAPDFYTVPGPDGPAAALDPVPPVTGADRALFTLIVRELISDSDASPEGWAAFLVLATAAAIVVARRAGLSAYLLLASFWRNRAIRARLRGLAAIARRARRSALPGDLLAVSTCLDRAPPALSSACWSGSVIPP